MITNVPTVSSLKNIKSRFSNLCLDLNNYVEIKMKNVFLILLFILPVFSFSQKIFTTDYPSQSDIKVFVVDYESQSDLKVFKVDYQSQSKGNEGLWYFVDYPSQSDKKIYFVDYPSQSDLKIYFVKYKSQSGWRNKSKQHLLY